MQDQLDQISDAEKAVFKNAIAGRIYLKLKSHPHRFSELESTIECSSHSLTKNLKKGQAIGVWEKRNERYTLTSKGNDLPDIIAVHASIQQDHKIVYKGTKYKHMNVEGGSSTVVDGVSGNSRGFSWSENYSEVINSQTTKVESPEELLRWFNPESFGGPQD